MSLYLHCTACRLRNKRGKKACKCGAALSETRASVWAVIRTDGVGKRHTLIVRPTKGPALKDAQLLDHAIQQAALHGLPWRPSPTDRATIGEIIADYLKSPAFTKLRERTRKEVENTLHFLERGMHKDTPADRLTPQFFARWEERRQAEGVSGSRIRREIGYLRVAVKRAARVGQLAANPMGDYTPSLKENAPRARPLSPEEYAAIINELPDYLVAPFELAYRLPFRRAEIVGMQWRWVDLDGQCVRIPAGVSKSGRARTVPFVYEHVGPMLKGLPSRFAGGHVFLRFTRYLGNFEHAFKHAVERAGVADVRWHDLKHCAVTNLLLQGVNPVDVQHYSDHQGAVIQARYTNVVERDILARAPKLKAIRE